MNLSNKVVSGVDRLNDFRDELQQYRVALLTTGAAMDRGLNSTLQVVNNYFDLTCLFGAEFGIMGEKQAGERYNSYTDVWTGLTVFSLYRYGSFHLSHEMLASFDVLLVDLPLSGLRYDSYITSIHRLMRQLGNTDKKMIILDRPNPIGAVDVEGPILEEQYKRDEDEVALPIRYGLTLGELALMMNAEDELNCDLDIIKVKNWKRSEKQEDTDRPWMSPQLRYPNQDACVLAAGLDLLRGTNVSYGLGTSLPYRVIGAPFIDGIQLAANLNKKYLSGVLFSPIFFTPTVGEYKGVQIQGVKINVMQAKKLKPLQIGITLIYEIKRLAGDDLIFKENEKSDGLLIDYLYGNSKLARQYMNVYELAKDAETEAQKFVDKASPYLLY